MAGPTEPSRRPVKRAPAKKATAKQTAAGAAAAGVAGPAPVTPPPGVPADGLSVNQWLHELQATPFRLEVFDRVWELKQPTGGRAATWDALIRAEGKGIRAALASMMADDTVAPERSWTDQAGRVHVLEALPGTARADEFLAAANEWVIPERAEEFWARIEGAIFGPGESSAS